MIEVRVFATFRENREKVQFLDAEAFEDALSIIEHLQIPVEEVAILLINGMHRKPSDRVCDGDVVALFPPIGGG